MQIDFFALQHKAIYIVCAVHCKQCSFTVQRSIFSAVQCIIVIAACAGSSECSCTVQCDAVCCSVMQCAAGDAGEAGDAGDAGSLNTFYASQVPPFAPIPPIRPQSNGPSVSRFGIF